MSWRHKKRSIDEAWNSVELDSRGLEDFNSGGGLIIEELDDKETEKYLKAFKKAKKSPEEPIEEVEPKKEKKTKTKATRQATPEDEEDDIEMASAEQEVKPKKQKKQKTTEHKTQIDESTTTKQALETPSKPSVDISAWMDMGLHQKILAGLSKLGFGQPTPVQSATIPESLKSDKDVIAAAETGSGKTLAFGLPIASKILKHREESKSLTNKQPNYRSADSPFGLIILPTRELATQVKDHMFAVCPSVSTVVVVGGMSVEKQHRLLKRNPDIVIGTPGRLAGVLGLAKTSSSDNLTDKIEGLSSEDQICTEFRERLPQCSWLVLDEADRLVEQGHFKDLENVLGLIYSIQRENKQKPKSQQNQSTTPSIYNLQTFIFSATLATADQDLLKLTRLVNIRPNRLTIDLSKKDNEVAESSIRALPSGLSFEVLLLNEEKDREHYLTWKILQFFFGDESQGNKKLVVFVNAITYVYRLTSLMRTIAINIKGENIRVVGLHSGIKQKDRLQRLEQFKHAEKSIVVATDLAARGLDLEQVGLVVHLQAPREAETLVHRSGRTARAGRDGVVSMIVNPKEIPSWRKVFFRATGQPLDTINKLLPNHADILRAKDILNLAADIEGGLHKEAKWKKENVWRKQAADQCDLVLSEDEDDFDPEILEDGQQSENPADRTPDDEYLKQKQKKATETLRRLLLEPVPSKIKRSKYGF